MTAEWRVAVVPAGVSLQYLARPSAAAGLGASRPYRDQSFGGEAGECGVERADRDRTLRSGFDFLPDRRAIGVIAELRDREHDVELELGQESTRHRNTLHHYLYNGIFKTGRDVIAQATTVTG